MVVRELLCTFCCKAYKNFKRLTVLSTKYLIEEIDKINGGEFKRLTVMSTKHLIEEIDKINGGELDAFTF